MNSKAADALSCHGLCLWECTTADIKVDAMERFHVQILLIVSLLFIDIGCMGTQTLDLTRPESEATVREIGDAVLGDEVTVTCIDGTMYEGEVLSQTDSSVVFLSPEITGRPSITWKDVCRVSVSGRPFLLYAAVYGGSFAGGLLGGWLDPPKHEGDVIPAFDISPIGAIVGGVGVWAILGRTCAERRYVIQSLNDVRDTLVVSETDIVSETNKRIVIQRNGLPVTYDRTIVSWKREGDRRLVMVPAKSK